MLVLRTSLWELELLPELRLVSRRFLPRWFDWDELDTLELELLLTLRA